jgi:diguanylate cyclase (GGDEF)-like protein
LSGFLAERVIKGIFSGLRVFGNTNALDDRVQRILVESLYAQPMSLLLGALGGVVTTGMAAYHAQNRSVTIAAATLAAIAFLRVGYAYILPLRKMQDRRLSALIFEIGALSYAGAVGLTAALTVFIDAKPICQLLTVTNAVAYGVGIAARNAGRPAVAIGQLALALVPTVIAFAIKDDLAHKVLAISLAMVIPAMTTITLSVFKVLRNSISAADTSAQLADRMQVLARSDVVTGLLNRAGLNHTLAQLVEEKRDGQKLALFWLDLDRFKEVNDSLGHQTGDKLLAEVASRLTAVAPDSAIVARFGGDEFVIACEASDRQTVEALAQRMLEEITRPMWLADHRLEISSSFGIALMPDDAQDIDGLLKSADLALYRSKVNGRKQISFFDPNMTRDLVRRREIEAELRQAIQRNELSIFFQPIIDLNTGRIRAFEALVRWFHPEKGELRPDEFIPVAEETGVIITLGNWITVQAAKAAATWPEDVTIAVNLSPIQIRAPGAALGILNALREARLDPRRLELEITETVLLDHSENTENFIAELGRAGVRFALDDFGTGYSSLSYLSKYPFSKIKVDRSFVSGSHAGEKSDAIIRAVSGMGATLGMSIVAEGLETIEQVNAVRRAGCTMGQGYYFSRAVPDYQAAMLLAKEQDIAEPMRRLA